MTWRIAADVGGTFTDVVATDGERHLALKIPSTPEAFDLAVREGVARALADTEPHDVEQLLHGTTAGTNAVLERSGPPVALVTTSGFRDVLEIGRLRTPAIYDLWWSKPPPLAPRRLRLEVHERTAADGAVLAEPDLDALAASVDEAVADGVRSFAVSLLNSYANPRNERLVARWLADRHPGVFVTSGIEIAREIGEFERTSTAVVNAYLRPVMSRYLDDLAAGTRALGIDAPTFIMQSSGGMMPIDEASQYPVHTLESGPAAGVLAAARVAELVGDPQVVSFDMGGTTAKASLIEDARVLYGSEFSVGAEVSSMSRLLRGGGYAVRLPVIDLAEIGAGGGSIAHVDSAGGLHVGPRSAGAEPGPACYTRGGTHATVTDANLVLGLISPAGLAAGGIDVDERSAIRVIRDRVATPLGLTVEEAAHAIHAVANQQMARVLRAVTTERGRDLRSHTLVAFGGSGPLHAATLADTVGIRRVVVPPAAGVFSAVGLLWSPVELTVSETVDEPLEPALAPRLDEQVRRCLASVTRRLRSAGFEEREIAASVVADLCFEGQASPLSIPVVGEVTPAALDALGETFRSVHLSTYQHGHRGRVTVVRIRVGAAVKRATPPFRQPTDSVPSTIRRRVWFDRSAGDVPVRTRAELAGGAQGPVLIDDPDTTVAVPPGWSVRTDASEHLVLERS